MLSGVSDLLRADSASVPASFLTLLTGPLRIGLRGLFLLVTTAETKTGVLLIETFKTTK